MNVNFNGFNENVATFIAANNITATGLPVKPSAEGAVAKCSSGDAFCGIVVGLRGGYASVQLSGYAEFPAAAKITVGFKKLAADASGKVAENANGREYLVVNSTNDTVGIIL
ncbi:MAG: hypothetical protein ABS876_04315 [Ruminococcus sp.]